jgi:hypothetical protein
LHWTKHHYNVSPQLVPSNSAFLFQVEGQHAMQKREKKKEEKKEENERKKKKKKHPTITMLILAHELSYSGLATRQISAHPSQVNTVDEARQL